jgi:putative phage-type endonuclease
MPEFSSPHFTIIELEQGTNEWHEWRRKGIGSSDAPAIMGENPFKTAAQLLKEKREPAKESVQNEAMALGLQLEPEARKRYIAKTGTEVRPTCLQSTRHDWLRASLDGFAVSRDSVVEIKCGQSVYRKTSEYRTVPGYYYGQMQHILAVTGFGHLDFWCYWPGCSGLLLPIQRNEAYIERLLIKELEFWKLVQNID